MKIMRQLLPAAAICFFVTTTHAQDPAATDRIRLMTAARNVCVVIAKFVDTPDPESQITYDQGKFKVVRSKTGITVFEDNIQIAQLAKFDYANYTDCLLKMVGDKK
jgi:hypothetical protein